LAARLGDLVARIPMQFDLDADIEVSVAEQSVRDTEMKEASACVE